MRTTFSNFFVAFSHICDRLYGLHQRTLPCIKYYLNFLPSFASSFHLPCQNLPHLLLCQVCLNAGVLSTGAPRCDSLSISSGQVSYEPSLYILLLFHCQFWVVKSGTV